MSRHHTRTNALNPLASSASVGEGLRSHGGASLLLARWPARRLRKCLAESASPDTSTLVAVLRDLRSRMETSVKAEGQARRFGADLGTGAVMFPGRNKCAIICEARARDGLTEGRSVIDGVDGGAKGVDPAEVFVVLRHGLLLLQFPFPSHLKSAAR